MAALIPTAHRAVGPPLSLHPPVGGLPCGCSIGVGCVATATADAMALSISGSTARPTMAALVPTAHHAVGPPSIVLHPP
eukprot:4575587-Prymnesium_polylepis.1